MPDAVITGFVMLFVISAVLLVGLCVTSAWLWWRHGLHTIIVLAGLIGLVVVPVMFFFGPHRSPLTGVVLGPFFFVFCSFFVSAYAALGRRATPGVPPRFREYRPILRGNRPGLGPEGLLVIFFYPAVVAAVLAAGAGVFALFQRLAYT